MVQALSCLAAAAAGTIACTLVATLITLGIALALLALVVSAAGRVHPV